MSAGENISMDKEKKNRKAKNTTDWERHNFSF